MTHLDHLAAMACAENIAATGECTSCEMVEDPTTHTRVHGDGCVYVQFVVDAFGDVLVAVRDHRFGRRSP